jgi:competence protein ComEA
LKEFFKNISFTKGESRVIIFLIAVLIIGSAIKYYKEVLSVPGDENYDYSRSDEEFRQRSLNIKTYYDSASTDSAGNYTASVERQKPDLPKEGSININTASREELVKLPGVGESIADKIIQYRDKRAFKRPEDLIKVPGIGRKKFEELKVYIFVN